MFSWGKKAALISEAEKTLGTLDEIEGGLSEKIFWWAASTVYEDEHRAIEFNAAASLGKCLETMLHHSRSGIPFQRQRLKNLISRLQRGLSVDIAAEHTLLTNIEAPIERWVMKTKPLVMLVSKFLPDEPDEEGDEGTSGETYEEKLRLIDAVPDPYAFIEAVARTLSKIEGSGLREEKLPKSLPRSGRPIDLIERHFSGTALPLFLTEIEVKRVVHVPFPVRFEHTHVLGGTGHGKTQFLQSLILKDLQAALEGKGSVVVIDGQGDLIRKITNLEYFDPDDPESLAEKLVLIDANDVEFPVALNMFALDEERLSQYSPADRERIFNATISLYEYFFGALLGADLTQRQGLIFKFLARLLFVIPDATIHTFLDVMENGEAYRPYMAQLDPTARKFFDQQFFDKAFDDTKQQIATRLWGVISNSTLNRMFSSTETRFDFFEAINSGKVVLINTAKDLLQADGNAIMGRFFIALLARAILQRQVIPEDRRRATFAYIDEIQDYIQNDNKIEDILNQARKYKTGILCAHQNLEQLSREQRASFAASTSTKFVGGLSAKDARAFSVDMRTSEDFLLSARKERDHTNFACFVKNVTDQAIMVPIEFGQMEQIGRISDEQYERLIEMNRAKYCVGVDTSGQTAQKTQKPPSGSGGFELGEPDLL